ncbi:MAG TPA: AraC family transcriptional regulator ligand-binding domain-containing protein [Thermoanaerobaculia bacterium]|nr:AraC family transcriptional regulator ligand-binding domain-containing protein [Thermoanaerobaculia bacterium]
MTDRASPSLPMAQPVRELSAFLDAFERLGYDRADLLRAARLEESNLRSPDALVPASATGAVLARAVQVRPLKNLALRLAMETPIGAYPLLDYLVVTCDTAGDALRELARYFRLVGAPVALDVFENEDPARVVFGPLCPDPSFAVEYTIALAVLHLRRETEGGLVFRRLLLERNPDDPLDFEARLGCPLGAPAAWSGLEVEPASLSAPMRRRDAALRGMLEQQANAAVPRGAATAKGAEDVRRAIARRVAGGDTRIESVARELAMSPRTLQRRLAAEGLAYQGMLASARRDAAERLLGDPALSAAEVGYLLGYSEPAAFHRAFKRWHGVTPVEYRRKLRA